MRNKTPLWIVMMLPFVGPGAFPSLLRADAASSNPAQNEIPPTAASSGGSATVFVKPPDGALQQAPALIRLQVGRHPTNGKFPYPFLGSVKAYIRPQVLHLHTATGTLAEFPVKVFYTKSGNFVRAEFVKHGAGDFQSSVETVEAASRQSSEAVTGLPEKTLSVSLESLFDQLHLPFENATRFNITYVMYKVNDTPPAPTILLNIFGLDSLVSARLGDEEAFRRIRIVMDENGKVQWEDNLL